MTNNPNPNLAKDSRSPNPKANSAATKISNKPKRAQRHFEIHEATIPQDDLWTRFQQNLHTFFGTVFSFLVHTVVLVALAFFVYAKQETKQLGMVAEIIIEPEFVASETIDAPLVIEIANEDEDHSTFEAESTENALAEDIPAPTIAETTDNDSAENIAPIENSAPVAPVAVSIIGGGLEGRTSGSRTDLAAQMGGNAQSELAVESGLKWLANHQHYDGSFRFDFTTCGDCNRRCKDAGSQESTTAATGLAMMAFLGAGYTHKSGPYQNEVRAGLEYLESRMRKTYFGGNLAEGTMYAQGIATIALSEAYSMTRDPDLLETVKSAMEYIVTAQHSAGGWRYTPGSPGDTTVTGWQVMALKSCELAGIEVPVDTIKKVKKYLASVGDESSGRFVYRSKIEDEDPTSTAIGLLLKIYLGGNREHRGLWEGSNYIANLGPSENNIYFNYYATLLMFHSRHSQWENWNQQMRDYLIQTQAQHGHETGSWFFKERYGSVGGRLYTTAMSVMILEVYYRYLPLFDAERGD